MAKARFDPNEPAARACRVCGDVRPIEEFPKHSQMSLGHTRRCKPCGAVYIRAHYKKYPEKGRAKSNKWLGKFSDEERKKISWRAHLKCAFRLTEGDYERLLEKQEGGCAICGCAETKSRNGHLCVDHDHETNKIRGLLCDPCNNGLGRFQDSVIILSNAAEYLVKADELVLGR